MRPDIPHIVTKHPKFFTWPTILACAVILVCVALFAYRPKLENNPGQQQESAAMLELQSKLFAGIANFDRTAAVSDVEQLRGLVGNRAGARAYAALLVYLDAEALRPDAIEVLAKFSGDSELDAAVRQAVESPDSLPEDRTALIRENLGWSGLLLLSQVDDRARKEVARTGNRLLIMFGAFIVLALGLLFLGLVMLVVAIPEFRTGKRRLRFQRESAFAPLYLEAFAAYLVGMIGFSALGAVVKTSAPTLWTMGAIAGSLCLALGWLVVRGIPWATLRQELGLHCGDGVLKELFAGVAGYIALLPILATGAAATIVLQLIASGLAEGTGGQTPVTHPVFAMAHHASLAQLLAVMAMAAVVGPFVEEVMFRGALYRALRSRLALAAALLAVAFIFAIVHPQGIIAVPGLLAMAVSLGLIREWRDSLIAATMAHGLHNGTLLVLLSVALA